MEIYIMILGLVAAVVALIIAGRKLEEPVLPALAIGCSVFYLIYNTYILNYVKDEFVITHIYRCLALAFALLLVSFISFLWIDDIVAKKNNKKSYDDSLSWFWNKI